MLDHELLAVAVAVVTEVVLVDLVELVLVVTELMVELKAITLTTQLQTEVSVVVALVGVLVLTTEEVMVVVESLLLDINYRRLLWHITQK